MNTTLRFGASGVVDCLYTEAIDLRALGCLQVTRATDIRFDPGTQQWNVHHADTGAVLFSDPSRVSCLQWEHDHLQPGGSPTSSAQP